MEDDGYESVESMDTDELDSNEIDSDFMDHSSSEESLDETIEPPPAKKPCCRIFLPLPSP